MEKKKTIVITCILCPYGCQVEVEQTGSTYQVSGNRCKQGKEYALNELTNPTRTLTSTVKTVFRDFPRLPVKTSREIPLGDVFRYMEEINTILVDVRLKPGDIVKTGLLGQDADLVATDNMQSPGED